MKAVILLLVGLAFATCVGSVPPPPPTPTLTTLPAPPPPTTEPAPPPPTTPSPPSSFPPPPPPTTTPPPPPGCERYGLYYGNGDIVESGPCYSCYCSDSQVICSYPPTCQSCDNPVHVPGECCPQCPPATTPSPTTPPLLCTDDGHTYQAGEQIITDDPCGECWCLYTGDIICLQARCLYCENAAFVEGQCCPLCDDDTPPPPQSCEYNGQTYQHEDTIDTHNPCEFCECRDGDVECAIMDCARPMCDNPVREEGQCCGTCHYTLPPPPTPTMPATCFYDGLVYGEGQRVGDDPCNFCECFSGEVVCAPGMACPSVENCANPVKNPGECCSSCPEGCNYNWQWYDNGAVLSVDSCESCTCYQGFMACLREECDFNPPCVEPVWGQCCPYCPEGNSGQ